MASTVQLNLTPEQASLLLPLLQNVALRGTDRENSSNVENLSPIQSSLNSSCSSSASSSDSWTNNSGFLGITRFTLEELLKKKKKNSKSTKAQNFLHVSVTIRIAIYIAIATVCTEASYTYAA